MVGKAYRDAGIEALTHDFSLGDAIEMGVVAYDLPEEIIVLRIIPERVAAARLSETVRTRVLGLVARVLAELDAPQKRVSQ